MSDDRERITFAWTVSDHTAEYLGEVDPNDPLAPFRDMEYGWIDTTGLTNLEP